MEFFRRLKSRYYVPSPEDPIPERLLKAALHRRVPGFPRTVQIQTMTGCNSACVFCPHPITAEGQPKGAMTGELFGALVDEMAAHGVRRVSPYLMNEPFLDPDMVDRLTLLKGKIPRARLVVTTNGSRLTSTLVDRIIESDALHALYISFQGLDRETYDAVTRSSVAFEEAMANTLTLIDKWKAAGGRQRFKVVVTMVKTNRTDAERAVAFWRSKGVESKWTSLENRGGNVSVAPGLAPSGAPMRRFATCTRLFKQAYILFDGTMVLCCTDYTRKMVLGNVSGSSIETVWNSPRAVSLRRLYAGGRSDEIPLCKECAISEAAGQDDPG